ncbi:MAG: glycoside hydrolase family 2 protein [Ruminococcaceae bacterium]|nr:glycoside hydrolase family 2 protein [Oscillospiraceae bacterium]
METFSLNGKWSLTGGGYNCEGTVPGSVYSFLLNNNLIDDPHWRGNEMEAVKILENDFTFSRKFDFKKANFPVLLHCDGLDTLCDIFLNNTLIASTDNMHRFYEFDVTDILADGENEIKIICHSPNNYVKAKHLTEAVPESQEPLRGFSYLRKAGYMMGWDWGPRLPDAGIWKDIYLIKLNSDRIADVHITQRHENGKVFVTPTVLSEKGSGEFEITLISPKGEAVSLKPNCENEIENPQLWWPNGFGKQPLYTVKINLLENGEIVDSNEKRIGLRTLTLAREKDEWGESFCHCVNGIKIFAMGADYIPEDNILSTLTKERTEKLLKHCVDANFNAIRVWGGGIYPHDYFYDLCDELGLLVFNDLMFACMCLPDDEKMYETVAVEVEQNLKRIRHHASIAIVSGNNEMEEAMQWWNDARSVNRKTTYLRFFENMIPKIAQKVCPELPYVPSSPSSFGNFLDTDNENYGDCHYWTVWHGGEPFSSYRSHYFRYLSEFGFESFPNEKTVNSFTIPEDRNIFSRVMELHQRCPGANKKILTYLGDTFKYPSDFGTLLYASQLLQAEAMRYGVEHLRRHRGRCMGALYWQLNDVWPVASWSSIDYFGRFKALQYAAKRFFAPVMISCHEIGEKDTRPHVIMQQDIFDYETKATLCVANETTNDVTGVVRWQLRNSSAQIIESGSEQITVPALTSKWLSEMDFNKTDVENNYLSYSFEADGIVVSSGSVLFTAPKHFNFKDPNLRYEIKGDEITVFADAYARYVEIDSPDSDFILSDNYFHMNAGEKTVKVLSGTPKTIKLRSCFDIK